MLLQKIYQTSASMAADIRSLNVGEALAVNALADILESVEEKDVFEIAKMARIAARTANTWEYLPVDLDIINSNICFGWGRSRVTAALGSHINIETPTESSRYSAAIAAGFVEI